MWEFEDFIHAYRIHEIALLSLFEGQPYKRGPLGKARLANSVGKKIIRYEPFVRQENYDVNVVFN